MINKWFVSTAVLALLLVGMFSFAVVQASPGDRAMGQGLGSVDVGNELTLPCEQPTTACGAGNAGTNECTNTAGGGECSCGCAGGAWTCVKCADGCQDTTGLCFRPLGP